MLRFIFSATVALILFIFAITSGSGSGWASAQVLAPLIISIVIIVAFFLWERWISPDIAAVYVTKLSAMLDRY